MVRLFSTAAALLRGHQPEGAVVRQAQDLLRDLGYERPGATGPDDETLHRARLLEAAAQFVRIFELGAPEAPGLFCFGAEIDAGGL